MTVEVNLQFGKIDVSKDIPTSLKQSILHAYKVNQDFFENSIPLNIFLVKTVEEFREKSKALGMKSERESWLVGRAKERNILLFLPESFPKVSDHPEEDFNRVLKHEMAHCFSNEYFKHKNLLFWFIEGLPAFVANGPFIRKALNNVPNFSKMITSEDFKKAGSPYRQCGSFVSFLVEIYNKKRLLSFLEELRDNDASFFVLFKRIYGIELKYLSNEFMEQI